MNFFTQEYTALRKPIREAVDRVFSSGSLILGSEGTAFEREFGKYLGVEHVIGVANGLEALQIGLMASGIGKGDEVITTALSAVATTSAITLLGATPVFVDIDDAFTIDVKKIESKITKRTKAIIPVHLYGHMCAIDPLMTLAKKYHLMVVEDACQAHGSMWNNKKAGSFGSCAAFSFYPTKNLGCYGDGGAIATRDKAFAAICRTLRNYGQHDRYVHQMQGVNSRLDEVQAAILRVKLPYLDAWNRRRNEIASYYNAAFADIPDIVIPHVRSGSFHSFHQYVIRTKKRDELLTFLRNTSIPALIHYPIPIHKQPCYTAYGKTHLPVVESVVNEILSLPIHPYMKKQEYVRVASAVQEFFAL